MLTCMHFKKRISVCSLPLVPSFPTLSSLCRSVSPKPREPSSSSTRSTFTGIKEGKYNMSDFPHALGDASLQIVVDTPNNTKAWNSRREWVQAVCSKSTFAVDEEDPAHGVGVHGVELGRILPDEVGSKAFANKHSLSSGHEPSECLGRCTLPHRWCVLRRDLGSCQPRPEHLLGLRVHPPCVPVERFRLLWMYLMCD